MAPSPPSGRGGQLRWSDLTPRQQAAVLKGRAAAEGARRGTGEGQKRATSEPAAPAGGRSAARSRSGASSPNARGTASASRSSSKAGGAASASKAGGAASSPKARGAASETRGRPSTGSTATGRSGRSSTVGKAARSSGPGRAGAAKGRSGGGAGRRPPAPERRRSFLWRWRRVLFTLGLLGFAAVAGVLFALSRIALPTAAPLSQTTFVYDSAGHTLASYKIENRVSVPLSDVPPVLVNAVVSTEDRHFFTEGGVNPVSIIRAFIADLQGNSLQGGSTITQQYVKQTYLTSQRTLSRKIKEAAIAVKLGHRDSKDTILDNYLNTIYFGRNAYGVEAASEAYFGKPVHDIGLREASLLAGLIREPETADPAHNATLARQNQADTLKAMLRDKKITAADVTGVENQSLSSYVLPPAKAAAVATSAIPGDEYFLAAVRQELLAKFPASLVDGGGLRVTTTLDPTLQAEGYDSVYGSNPDALHPEKGDPAGALVSVDDNGYVRAMVGGEGYGAAYTGSQVNLALGTAGGGSGRQAGSTFKAFMLAYLVKAGYSVNSTFPAPPEVVVPHGNANGTPWDVTNFEKEAGSPTTSIIDATAQSINTVYAQIVEKLGPQNLVDMAEALGIAPSELPGAYPSQVLGTADVSPLEMAAAYATFANQGVYTAPILITKVTKADGTPLPWTAKTTRQVLSVHDADVVNYVLQQVVLRGTGGAAGGVGSPVAGKTGTTENSANAWFVGYTPKLTTAVWMGYPAGNIPIVRFTHDGHYYKSVQGADIPAPLWHTYMAAAIKSEPDLAAGFPPVYYFGGQVLQPPAANTLLFPLGMGTTTTSSTTSTSTTSTTAPPASTTVPATTPPTAAPTTPAATVPATTVPPTTAPSVATTAPG